MVLDQPDFPTADPRAGRLLKLLMADYGMQTRARQLATLAGIANAEVSWERSMAEVWPDLLELAARTGRLRPMVHAAAGEVHPSVRPFLADLLAERPAPVRPGVDPFRSGLINNGKRAFLNQSALRSRLRAMVADGPHRVLLVEGGPRTGRTFTWFLIHHVLDSQGIVPCRIRIGEYTEPVRVTELAEFFNQRFRDWRVDIDRYASEDRQADGLVRQLKGRLSEERLASPGRPRHWLVFDDSEAVRFTEPALRVLVRLVEAVVEEEAADRLRIVLLAHDGWLPQHLHWDVATERLGCVRVEDLRDFFLTLAEQAGRPIDAETAGALVAKVLDDADHESCPPGGLLQLTDQLQRTAAGLGRDLVQGR
ncbi:effector-associated domain EAD1-containing protein [Kitasatospora sp. NPDC006697]|uniref:effector-associated domain EAD1-containing protein n=1 Tax=Kitasatospora sp. NPDC006697 TaxID=3364020 RepID=UPI00368EA513